MDSRQVNPAACLKTQGDSVPVTTAGLKCHQTAGVEDKQRGHTLPGLCRRQGTLILALISTPQSCACTVKTGASRTGDLQEAH